MWYARVGQVERRVKFLGGHGRIGRIDHHTGILNWLDEPSGMHHVRLLLNVAEVLGLGTLVAEALLMAVQHDVVGGGYDVAIQIDRLWNRFK